MNTATATASQTHLVGMGESVVLHGDETARAVVGSCIGLVLYSSRQKISAMAHIVLPEAAGRPGAPGKFADTAIPHLLEMLAQEGVGSGGLVALLAGGAQMFGKQGPLQIGIANSDAVSTAIKKLGITIRGTHVGGDKGRRISFDNAAGTLTVECAGATPIVL